MVGGKDSVKTGEKLQCTVIHKRVLTGLKSKQVTARCRCPIRYDSLKRCLKSCATRSRSST